MQLTGLEVTLIGGGIATGSAIITLVGNKIAANSKLKEYVHRHDFDSRVKLCEERRDATICEVTKITEEVQKLDRKFVRFITHSDLSKDSKIKILNGE